MAYVLVCIIYFAGVQMPGYFVVAFDLIELDFNYPVLRMRIVVIPNDL